MADARATPAAESLRALAHPVRLRILGLLRSEGSATATSLAGRLGLNSGATSYHLRQLARHGYIEDDLDGAHAGSRRERWWRAAHRSTEFGTGEEDDAARDAVGAFLQAVAVVQAEQVQHAVEERQLLPARWRQVSALADWEVRLTPARARDLLQALESLVDETDEEPADTEDSEDSATVVVQLAMFPRPGTVVGDGAVDPEIDRDG